MDYLQQSFTVKFEYKVHFTTRLFDSSNCLLGTFLKDRHTKGITQKILFIIDDGVSKVHPQLTEQIKTYFSEYRDVQLIPELLIIPGGEQAKNNPVFLEQIIDSGNRNGIDRHSYLAAIGGGSILDLAGYAAAISHRGVKHIRIPTTVLSQNDSGVGVKNGVNYQGKKNFLGTFVPPVAVFNDFNFLTTLTDRDWRSGISEAVKVALIKDAAFFYWLEENASVLVARNMPAMEYLIKRCAELHLQHIASGDPFELGSARPLDFGHWSAHKLEQLSNFEVFHGEAVAMGIALDSVYSNLSGRLSKTDSDRIVKLLLQFGFEVTHPLLEAEKADSPILKGLQEFQEHLGGKLTITMLVAIGKGQEVNEMDHRLICEAGKILKEYQAVIS
ncbi:3-dehydroquinate synthase [Rubrolithibacter danxiaensis]|uniref:3-dehydroquinate synthase n=1 Tax=Rubrolithibacter danxiaensis TaxID=3390805 RepID=UPI003BF83434